MRLSTGLSQPINHVRYNRCRKNVLSGSQKAAIESGMRDCKTMKTLIDVPNDNGHIVLLMAAHVGDVISVCVPEYERILEVLSNFDVKKSEEGGFRFCGREYFPDKDFSVYVTCKDNT